MDKKEIMSLFENEEEAQDILEKSRKRIDEIDNDLVNLISERTSLARSIVLAEDLNIDKSILSDIMDMLTTLSKNRQREILEEWLWEILELHS